MIEVVLRMEKSVKEIIFDPRNMAITFCAGIGIGLLVELLIRLLK
jgi:hypothetical protein